MSVREAVERELALMEAEGQFDPKLHPRDRVGRFRNVLALLRSKHPVRSWELNHPLAVEVGAGLIGAVGNEIAGMADPGVKSRKK